MLPYQAKKPNYHHYLEGGGEMGWLIREYDWSKTVIGSPEQWSQSLLTTISIIISSRFPMFLWWGPELIQFYNDAYRKSLGDEGKHPTALGQRGEDCWPEIWDTVQPMINQALTGGDATWCQDTKHTENISGFGIGLYLCSEILEHHGGKIWVESEIGIGSTFHFSLPVIN